MGTKTTAYIADFNTVFAIIKRYTIRLNKKQFDRLFWRNECSVSMVVNDIVYYVNAAAIESERGFEKNIIFKELFEKIEDIFEEYEIKDKETQRIMRIGASCLFHNKPVEEFLWQCCETHLKEAGIKTSKARDALCPNLRWKPDKKFNRKINTYSWRHKFRLKQLQQTYGSILGKATRKIQEE